MQETNHEEQMLLTAIRFQKEVNQLILDTISISTTANITVLLQSMSIPQLETLNNIKTEALKRQYISPEKADQNKIKCLSEKFKDKA